MTKLTEKELELVEGYVRGELTQDEGSFVEQKVNSSEEWARQLQLYSMAVKAGKFAFEERMRSRFRIIDRQGSGSAIRRWLTGAAAAAGILILVVAYFTLKPVSFRSEAIAAYQDFPNVAYPIEKSAASSDNRAAAYQAYELKEYQKAESLFMDLRDMDVRDELYLGLSQLGAREYTAAGDNLTAVLQSGEKRWTDVADWYMIWVEIGLDKVDAAEARAERISQDSQHRYREDAEDLL